MANTMLTIPEQQKLGSLHITNGVAMRMESDNTFHDNVQNALTQYRSGDWGDLDEEDWEQNQQAVKLSCGNRIMGCYNSMDGTRFWIITEGYGNQKQGPDYCYTTVLFPEEY